MAKLLSWNADTFAAAANPAALFDAVSETGGTLTLATIDGMPGKHLAFSGDGENNADCRAVWNLPAPCNQVVVRALVEATRDFVLGGDAALDGVVEVINAAGTRIVGGRIDANMQYLRVLVRRNSGETSAIVGYPPTGKMYELWLVVNISADAGYSGMLGTTGSLPMVRPDANDQVGPATAIRLGLAGADHFAGSLCIHELDVWDGKPDELADIHYAAAAGDYRSGLPAVLDIAAAAGGTVTAIDVRRSGGDWQSVSMTTADAVKGTAPVQIATLTAAGFDLDAGTLDGCLLSGTARVGLLCPDRQIVRHFAGSGVGTVCTADYPLWLALEDNQYWSPQQICTAWRWREVAAGVYRVGLPGSVIRCGRHEVRLTFADESTATATFDAYAIGRGEVGQHPPGGKHISVAYDDGRLDHPTQMREVYSLYPPNVRPLYYVAFGRTGCRNYASLAAFRWAMRGGAGIGCHLWDDKRVDQYASDQEAADYLRLSRDVMVLAGMECSTMATPGGNGTLPGGGSAMSVLLSLWAAIRSSTSAIRNAVPLNLSAQLNAKSLYNQSYAGATAADKAAAFVAALDAGGDAPGWWLWQVHTIGDGDKQTSSELVRACIDAAIAAGYRFERLDRMLAASEE